MTLSWKSFTALLAGSIMSLSAVASAATITYTSTPINPPANPYPAGSCLPTIVPSGMAGRLQTNSYLAGPIVSNPSNKQILVTRFGIGGLKINGFSGSSPGLTPIGRSTDRGRTWTYTNIPFTPCLGGDLSQTASGGELAYDKDGKLLYLVGGYSDTEQFTHNIYPRTGKFVTTSRDNGKTWTTPLIISTTPGSLNNNFEGTSDGGGESIASDLEISHRAYIATQQIEFPDALYGNITFFRTKNLGKSFSQERVIYDMALDSKWLATYLNTHLDRAGGQSLAPTLLDIPGPDGKPVLLCSFLRFFPNPISTTYSQGLDPYHPDDSLSDHAVIRSFDHGKTWETQAHQISLFNFAESFNPTQPQSEGIIVFDNSLGNALAYSKSSGKVYCVWQGSSTAPSLANPFPAPDLISLSVSADQGATWSTPIKANLTNALFPNGNQAFNANIAIIKNGYVGVTYVDYRNYTNTSTDVQTDVWLAIYKEVSGAGPTGIGLEFVQEVRLTPSSFNALVGYNSTEQGATSIPGITANGDDFFITFAPTGTDTIPPRIIDDISVDTNNRFNTVLGDVDIAG